MKCDLWIEERRRSNFIHETKRINRKINAIPELTKQMRGLIRRIKSCEGKSISFRNHHQLEYKTLAAAYNVNSNLTSFVRCMPTATK